MSGFCGDLKDFVGDGNLFSALEEVDRLGDIDMEPMDLLGSDNTENFDLFAEIEKYETSSSLDSTNEKSFNQSWENSVSAAAKVENIPLAPKVQLARTSVIVGRPPQPQSLPAGVSSKSPKILPAPSLVVTPRVLYSSPGSVLTTSIPYTIIPDQREEKHKPLTILSSVTSKQAQSSLGGR